MNLKNKLKKIPKIFLDLIRSSNRVVPFYNPKYWGILYRAFCLLIYRKFDANEALQVGLLDRNVPETDLDAYVSKREMVQIQKTVNPESFERMTENKGLFYKYCISVNIPVPELYALFFHKTAGYTTDGTLLKTCQDWEKFINSTLPSYFVIKPTVGAYGSGFLSFSRVNDGDYINESSGNRFNSKEIYEILYSSRKDFVIQERIYNHEDLRKLSNTLSLQTLRIWTFVDIQGRSQILTAFFKPIVGNNVTDNYDHGRSGNLCTDIDLSRGTLKSGIKSISDESGILTIHTHPTTGIPFEGYPIPFWSDICRAAKRASLKFLPLRLIGWDIAVTQKGPVFIEANIFSDPPNDLKTSGHIRSAVKNDLIIGKELTSKF